MIRASKISFRSIVIYLSLFNIHSPFALAIVQLKMVKLFTSNKHVSGSYFEAGKRSADPSPLQINSKGTTVAYKFK